MNNVNAETTLNRNGHVVLPVMQIPSFRTGLAIQDGVEWNLLIKTWGGIGDQICSEPTLRYAVENFKGVSITLCSDFPEVFAHLKFSEVITPSQLPEREHEFLAFETIRPVDHLTWEFMSHMLVNCIDYASLCSFRCMMPNSFKPIQIYPTDEQFTKVASLFDGFSGGLLQVPHIKNKRPWVAVHAGKHWTSKTFPKDWWDDTLHQLLDVGVTPVLIGADCDDNRGTVDVNTEGCFDLRGKLSLMESIALLKAAPVVITNDSAPLHMAAAGTAWIGYIATVKHPDFITHWRGPKAEFGWRMENLGLGGFWDQTMVLPNVKDEVSLEFIPEETLRSWLPEPAAVASWVRGKL